MGEVCVARGSERCSEVYHLHFKVTVYLALYKGDSSLCFIALRKRWSRMEKQKVCAGVCVYDK